MATRLVGLCQQNRAKPLRQVAPKNDAVIISTVASLMEDRHTGVCCSAVQVGIRLVGERVPLNVDPGCWFTLFFSVREDAVDA